MNDSDEPRPKLTVSQWSKTKSTMVRIPADLAQALDRLVEQHAVKMGVPGSPEITRTLMHHIALRRGVELMLREVVGG